MLLLNAITRLKQQHTHIHTPHLYINGDNDVLIFVLRGHCREAGAEPDAASQTGWKTVSGILSYSAYRAKAVTARHQGFNVKQI